MKNGQKRLKQVGLHILGWLLFPILTLTVFINEGAISQGYEFLFVVFNLCQFAILLYPSIYYAIPRLLHQRKIKQYIGFSALLVLIATLWDFCPVIFFESANLFISISIGGEEVYKHLHYQADQFPNYGLLVYFLTYYFVNIWYLIAISALKLVYDTLKNRYEMEVMTREKLQSELKFLREQNNPHFLFNNLNSLYVMIEESPATAQQMLLKLSNMLRYQLYDAGSDKIPVKKEFDYIQNYIDLQQLRYSEAIDTELDLGEVPESCTIEPYLLFTLVENAFKHGIDAPTTSNYLKIQADFREEWLVFTVENPLNPHAEPNQEASGGFGLTNLQKRLNLLYPENHDYQVETGAAYYRTTLKLPLACH